MAEMLEVISAWPPRDRPLLLLFSWIQQELISNMQAVTACVRWPVRVLSGPQQKSRLLKTGNNRFVFSMCLSVSLWSSFWCPCRFKSYVHTSPPDVKDEIRHLCISYMITFNYWKRLSLKSPHQNNMTPQTAALLTHVSFKLLTISFNTVLKSTCGKTWLRQSIGHSEEHNFWFFQGYITALTTSRALGEIKRCIHQFNSVYFPWNKSKPFACVILIRAAEGVRSTSEV